MRVWRFGPFDLACGASVHRRLTIDWGWGLGKPVLGCVCLLVSGAFLFTSHWIPPAASR